MRKQMRKQLKFRIAGLDETTVSIMAFEVMYGLEGSGYAVVPIRPTTPTIAASMTVARKGPIRKVWLSEKAKHRLRLIAAYQAAPNWKAAFQAERKVVGTSDEGSS